MSVHSSGQFFVQERFGFLLPFPAAPVSGTAITDAEQVDTHASTHQALHFSLTLPGSLASFQGLLWRRYIRWRASASAIISRIALPNSRVLVVLGNHWCGIVQELTATSSGFSILLAPGYCHRCLCVINLAQRLAILTTLPTKSAVHSLHKVFQIQVDDLQH